MLRSALYYDRARAEYRGALGVELRMQGYSYDDLAELLGYADRSGARKAVMRAVRARRNHAVDLYRIHRMYACEDIERLQWPRAMRGDARALAKVLRAGLERAELAGAV